MEGEPKKISFHFPSSEKLNSLEMYSLEQVEVYSEVRSLLVSLQKYAGPTEVIRKLTSPTRFLPISRRSGMGCYEIG